VSQQITVYQFQLVLGLVTIFGQANLFSMQLAAQTNSSLLLLSVRWQMAVGISAVMVCECGSEVGMVHLICG